MTVVVATVHTGTADIYLRFFFREDRPIRT